MNEMNPIAEETPRSGLLKHISRIHAESCIRPRGFVMPSYHCHEYFELFYVQRGACRYTIQNNMFDLHEGDFILIPPQALHYTRYLFGECRRSVVFFRTEDVPEEILLQLPGGRDFFSQMRIFLVPELERTNTEALLSKMVREELILDQRSPLMLSLLFSQLLLYCSRVCLFPGHTPADIATTDRGILLAARYISDHYMESISSSDIAAAAGLSPNYLTRKFREAVGIGLREYLIFTRLQRAALELVSTDASITEIALHCGFSDGNYFKDVFKKNYGTSPSTYRKTGKA